MHSGLKEAQQMKRASRPAIGSFAIAILGGAIAHAADEKVAPPAAVVARYSGIANVAATPLTVEIKDWYFVRAPRDVRLQVLGFYIAQLRSGEIDTEIDGKKEHRRAGDFWTVAAGKSMTVRFPPRREAAHLQTITITPGVGRR